MTIRPNTLSVRCPQGVYLKDSVVVFLDYKLTEKHEQIHGWMVPADKNDNHSCVRNTMNTLFYIACSARYEPYI